LANIYISIYVWHWETVSKQELEDLFTDYGKIIDTKIMNGFGFVEFEDPMDAKDVVPGA